MSDITAGQGAQEAGPQETVDALADDYIEQIWIAFTALPLKTQKDVIADLYAYAIGRTLREGPLPEGPLMFARAVTTLNETVDGLVLGLRIKVPHMNGGDSHDGT